MRPAIMIFMVLALVGTAMAQNLGSSRDLPVKDTPIQRYHPPVENKQGGDTIYDAFPFDGLPYTITGTTTGYNNDYDWECPYDSMSPDVVYSFTPASDIRITVDLCGSAYDTKTYIFDADLNVIACNDDYYYDEICGYYTSLIEEVDLTGGGTYYIVIDGYGGDHGEYLLNFTEFEPCFVTCPAEAVPEGEPALHDGYDDQYNSGCGGLPPSWQPIDWTNDEDGVPPYDGHAWLCGQSGWYLGSDNLEYRDTDWFTVTALETGTMEVMLESEHPCFLFKLAPPDCANVAVELQALADCQAPATLIFPVTAGEEIWLWVGPTTFSGPVTEFTYFMTVTNNQFDVVPTEDMSWGQVKALYR